MKKITLNTKPLSLAKEEIANLSSSELNRIVGGLEGVDSFNDCTTKCPQTQLMGCVETNACPPQTTAPGCVMHSIPADTCVIISRNC